MSRNTEERRKNLKYTIVLSKPLPRVEYNHNRWLVDGKKMLQEEIHKLLIAAGHKITPAKEICKVLPREIEGIRIEAFNYGMMVCPKEPEDFVKLKEILTKIGCYSHLCGMKSWNGL